MLRANRRLLRRQGRIAFLTIEVAPGLDSRRRRAAAAAGPPGIATRSTYASMMRTAGFVDIVRQDLTAEYRTTADAWRLEWRRHRAAYEAATGADDFDEKQATADETVAAIDAGLLARSLYTARRR